MIQMMASNSTKKLCATKLKASSHRRRLRGTDDDEVRLDPIGQSANPVRRRALAHHCIPFRPSHSAAIPARSYATRCTPPRRTSPV